MYHELAKQSDDTTRRTMAALMDEFSEGIRIQPPNLIERIELKRHILQVVLGPDAPDVGEWLWVKASGVFGEMIPVPKAKWTPEEVTFIQKVVFEGLLNLPISVVAEFQEEKRPVDDLKALADAYNADARKYRENKVPFERVYHEEMAHLFHGRPRLRYPTPIDELVDYSELAIAKNIDLSRVEPGFFRRLDFFLDALKKALGWLRFYTADNDCFRTIETVRNRALLV